MLSAILFPIICKLHGTLRAMEFIGIIHGKFPMPDQLAGLVSVYLLGITNSIFDDSGGNHTSILFINAKAVLFLTTQRLIRS